MFDFMRAAVFCLGHRFSKHKMTGYAKNLGGRDPMGVTPPATPIKWGHIRTR